MRDLAEWESYYVIVGGAAGALIGLQFVVMTLVADRQTTREGAQAFTTPTVVYFATALLLAALASVPWRGLALLSIAWGAIGLAGVVYGLIVLRHMRRQDIYTPVLEDWFFNLALPSFAYAALIVAAAIAGRHAQPAICIAAAVALLLLLIGVRNSWDVISYHVTVSRPGNSARPEDSRSA
jgi:modulator of FtsH protease